ncbi:M20/M25/M40 family metallo-hydrolase [Nocardioides sp. W7]|uniref:M20/M25/M40 family metallo-hydrolase n=1 Tax=Nocardioides sp. W7 TaxID=2931390 RepID=UPI001FD3713A|nr:M20/M25/M40 family metallo-hydrolase [Nocardioides sp. W7]
MPEGVADLAALLEPRLDDILALAASLTEVESGSYVPAGVDRVSSLVAEQLAPLGFTASTHSIGPDRGQAFEATLETGRPGLRVLVLGHADTVWPAGATADWPVVTDRPVMSGPGLGDMKCALAMAVHAIAAALETGVPGVASITYALVPDEELGSVGSRDWLADLGRRTDVCLALEAGQVDGGVIVSRGAVGAMIITARGRTAHSTDENGASAVAALAPLVAGLEALTDRSRRTICTVGILRGGTARQVVPDHAELHLDLRAPDDAAGEALVAEVRRLAEAGAGAGVTVEISGGITRPALPRTVTDPVYALAEELAFGAGLALRRIDEMGGSDASLVGQLAPLALDGLGPTAFDQCSRAETVLRDSVVPRTALLAALIAQAGRLAVHLPDREEGR